MNSKLENFIAKAIEYKLLIETKTPTCGGQEYSLRETATFDAVKDILRLKNDGFLQFVSRSAYDDTCYLWINLANQNDFGGYFVQVEERTVFAHQYFGGKK